LPKIRQPYDCWALYRGLEISCGCFGSSTGVISYSVLIRALGILLISLAAYLGVVLLEVWSTYRYKMWAEALF